MKIIVLGGGKVGLAIAAETAREGHDVTIIDNDRETVEQLSAALDIMVIYGNGAAMDVLEAAGIANTHLLIAATAQDEMNMFCCILGRKLGCANTIARVRNPEYADELYLLRRELGLSLTINPDAAAAREVFRLLQFPGVLKRDSFARSRVEIVAVLLRHDSPLCGKKLLEMPRLIKPRVLVCAVQRGGEVTIPGGNFELREDDEVYFTAPGAELSKLMEGTGLRKRRTRDVLIIGGSRIAVILADMLTKAGIRVKLIEKDPEHSAVLAERLDGVTIICADGSDQPVLRSENISQMDAVVTLTDRDEENIIISLYARSVGVPQVITKINRTEYSSLFLDRGIDCVVSPKQLCAQEVVRYIRAMQNSGEGSMISMHHLVDGKAEALEFEVPEHGPYIDRPLSELRLKPNVLIACISRRGKTIFPGGADCLMKGDVIVVVTTANRVIIDLRDIFDD